MISACFTWYEGFRWVPLCPHHGVIFFWDVKMVGNKRKEQQLLMLVFATYNLREERRQVGGRGMRMTQSCVYPGQPFPCYQPIKEGCLLGSTEHGGGAMFLTTLVDICTSCACRNAHPRKWYHSDCCFMDALTTLYRHTGAASKDVQMCVFHRQWSDIAPWITSLGKLLLLLSIRDKISTKTMYSAFAYSLNLGCWLFFCPETHMTRQHQMLRLRFPSQIWKRQSWSIIRWRTQCPNASYIIQTILGSIYT